MGAVGIKLSHDAQLTRATWAEKPVESRPGRPQQLGCHGMSQLVRGLPYVDYNNVFLVPIFHAWEYGVVKSVMARLIPAAITRAFPQPYIMCVRTIMACVCVVHATCTCLTG